jgi:hypothetical protein
MHLRPLRSFALLCCHALAALSPLAAQPEVMQWGNVRGLRVEGHLHRFDTRFELIRPDGSLAGRTAHYANASRYTREGAVQRTVVQLGGREVRQAVQLVGARGVRIDVEVARGSGATAEPGAIWFTLEVPGEELGEATVRWIGAPGEPFSARARLGRETPLSVRGEGIELVGRDRRLTLRVNRAVTLALPTEASPAGGVRVRVELATERPAVGQTVSYGFVVETDGVPDRRPVALTVDPGRPGRPFDGIGGNFRLQFPETDPAIIDYKLANLRVAWSRIAFWWRDWDMEESGDPLAAARAGKVTDRQRRQMEMARRLARSDIPVMVSVWDPPPWAVASGPRRPGTYSDAISPAKWPRMAESIGAYLQYLKEQYGVEAAMFSFNEPDLGLQPTAEEHIGMIKELGRAFAARGLGTKLLLADTSNGTRKSLRYAELAVHDLDARRYVAAVGFHTWGGTSDEELAGWDTVARDLGLPLMVTEGGPDAEAHRHPDLFYEPAYQFDEIELYARIAARIQPASILHWQLTADYTLLEGGGAYGRKGPLTPTPRFWAFRQLGSTPRGAFALPAAADHTGVTIAAFGHLARSEYAVHVFNRGAARSATLTGLPTHVASLTAVVTDRARGMESLGPVAVEAGRATLELPGESLVSLFTLPPGPPLRP